MFFGVGIGGCGLQHYAQLADTHACMHTSGQSGQMSIHIMPTVLLLLCCKQAVGCVQGGFF
jgi:hypothetical protein